MAEVLAISSVGFNKQLLIAEVQTPNRPRLGGFGLPGHNLRQSFSGICVLSDIAKVLQETTWFVWKYLCAEDKISFSEWRVLFRQFRNYHTPAVQLTGGNRTKNRLGNH